MSRDDIRRVLDFKSKIEKRFHHPNLDELQGWKSAKEEGKIPKNRLNEEKSWALKMICFQRESIKSPLIGGPAFYKYSLFPWATLLSPQWVTSLTWLTWAGATCTHVFNPM